MDSRRKILAGQSDCYVLCLTDLFHLEFGIRTSHMLSQTAARSLPSFCPEMTRKGTLPFRRSPGVFPRYGRIKAPDRWITHNFVRSHRSTRCGHDEIHLLPDGRRFKFLSSLKYGLGRFRVYNGASRAIPCTSIPDVCMVGPPECSSLTLFIVFRTGTIGEGYLGPFVGFASW
ncbi:hypothetical protein M404DRAFT_733162 [Pisolithus tinctorius Marx 270]|uniref:Uncharacterized protein n=1 Tax=Pisolithus tinctorius Marx 270 TaxID=870435 RepID=A0A0C3JVG7_PISTI|nr:hypothetical protein M404DRAFT_733162 [Pisolithus tinctorius Marx 270]